MSVSNGNVISNNIDEYYRLKKHGCYFQINLLSTTGYYGADIVKKSEILLANNMIDFVGSDIHKAKHISHFDDEIKITQIKALEKSIVNNKLFKLSYEARKAACKINKVTK